MHYDARLILLRTTVRASVLLSYLLTSSTSFFVFTPSGA